MTNNDAGMQRLWQAVRAVPDEPVGEHLGYQEYADYLADRLPARYHRRVETHLESCQVCTARAARLATLLHLADQLRGVALMAARGGPGLAWAGAWAAGAVAEENWITGQTPDGSLRWQIVEESGAFIVRFGSHQLDLEGSQFRLRAGDWQHLFALARVTPDQVGAEVVIAPDERAQVPEGAGLRVEVLLEASDADSVGGQREQMAPPSDMTSADEIHEVGARDVNHPLRSVLPPRVEGFVGRASEVTRLLDQLASSHLVILTGMPGIGKTTLAAVLANRLNQPARTFWHSFHAGEGVHALVWKLAGFLFWKDQPQLWSILRRSQETGGQPPPSDVLFDYLFEKFQGESYLLCFDDFHFVEEDPLLGQFMDGLRTAIDAGELSVIFTSQHRPEWSAEAELEQLGGLGVSDLSQLLRQRGVRLPAQLVATLHQRTEGSPHLLTLALDGLKRSNDPARLINRLSESEHVERFLMKEVGQGLTPEERQLMGAVAVFMGYPSTRDAISTVLEGHSTRRELNDLASRYLLTVTDGEVGKEYSQHILAQPFYYDLLHHSERQAMHLLAGEYYEKEEPDVLKAARHYQRAGEEERAAALITGDVWAILNQGQAQPLRQLLAEGFTARTLTAEALAAINLARGQVFALLGETPPARTSYEAAYASLATFPDQAAVRELKARACHSLGELLQYEAPNEALAWLRRGLDVLGGASPQQEAALRIRTGRLLAYLGKNSEALAELQRGLALLPEGPSRLRLSALGNLGNIHYVQRDTEHGQDYYRQVLDIARQLQDHWAMVEVWINMGIELDIAGRWEEALTQYLQALEEAERLGSARQRLRVKLAIVNTQLKMGSDEAARQGLIECRDIAQDKGWKDNLVYIGNALAEVCLREGNLSAADEFLAEGAQLASETGVREPLPDLYRHWALVRLGQGRPLDALAYAENAVILARELEDRVFEGTSLRVLGQAQWANQQREAAEASFERSLTLLGERDPYEAARTKREWR